MKRQVKKVQTLTSSSKPKANDRQVGGDHYKNLGGMCPHCSKEINHWDLYAKMPYLLGYATKELTRHEGKNGVQDLRKAKHIIDKMIEVYYPDAEPEA
jgi:hypothetical protein